MHSLKLYSISGLALVATAVTGLVATSGDGACGRPLQIANPELRATFAALDRSRDADFTAVCASFRAGAAR